MNFTLFQWFFEKIVWENKELKKRWRRFIRLALVFGIPSMILLIIDTFTSHEEIIGIFGLFAIALLLPFFFFWGAIEALELAEKITRKQQ